MSLKFFLTFMIIFLGCISRLSALAAPSFFGSPTSSLQQSKDTSAILQAFLATLPNTPPSMKQPSLSSFCDTLRTNTNFYDKNKKAIHAFLFTHLNQKCVCETLRWLLWTKPDKEPMDLLSGAFKAFREAYDQKDSDKQAGSLSVLFNATMAEPHSYTLTNAHFSLLESYFSQSIKKTPQNLNYMGHMLAILPPSLAAKLANIYTNIFTSENRDPKDFKDLITPMISLLHKVSTDKKNSQNSISPGDLSALQDLLWKNIFSHILLKHTLYKKAVSFEKPQPQSVIPKDLIGEKITKKKPFPLAIRKKTNPQTNPKENQSAPMIEEENQLNDIANALILILQSVISEKSSLSDPERLSKFKSMSDLIPWKRVKTRKIVTSLLDLLANSSNTDLTISIFQIVNGMMDNVTLEYNQDLLWKLSTHWQTETPVSFPNAVITKLLQSMGKPAKDHLKQCSEIPSLKTLEMLLSLAETADEAYFKELSKIKELRKPEHAKLYKICEKALQKMARNA